MQKNCNYQFTRSTKHDKSEILKLFVLLLYLSLKTNDFVFD